MTNKLETLATGLHLAEAPRLDDDGTLYFTDVLAGVLYRLPPGGVAGRIGRRISTWPPAASSPSVAR